MKYFLYLILIVVWIQASLYVFNNFNAWAGIGMGLILIGLGIHLINKQNKK